MNAQASRILSLSAGEARRLGAGRGELTVLRGRVWLTDKRGPGDDSDRVLVPGDTACVADAEAAVVESWRRDEAAVLRWQPCVQRAGLVGIAGNFLAALAR